MADFVHSITLRLHVVPIRLLEGFYLVTLMKGAAAAAAAAAASAAAAAAAAADFNNDNNFSDFTLYP